MAGAGRSSSSLEALLDSYRSRFADPQVHLRPDLPVKKVARAIKAYAPTVRPDQVLVQVDTTALGSGKEGMLLTTDQLFFGGLGTTRSTVLPAASAIETTDVELTVDGDPYLISGSGTGTPTLVAELIGDLRSLQVPNRPVPASPVAAVAGGGAAEPAGDGEVVAGRRLVRIALGAVVVAVVLAGIHLYARSQWDPDHVADVDLEDPSPTLVLEGPPGQTVEFTISGVRSIANTWYPASDLVVEAEGPDGEPTDVVVADADPSDASSIVGSMGETTVRLDYQVPDVGAGEELTGQLEGTLQLPQKLAEGRFEFFEPDLDVPVTVQVVSPVWGPLGTIAFWLIVPCLWVVAISLFLRYRSGGRRGSRT